MPASIHDEISMAYAKEKPILLLCDSNVVADGFTSNYGTYLAFSRDELYKSEFLAKAIASIHNLKMATLLSHDVLMDQEEISNFYTEKSLLLISLEKDNNGYYWHYSTIRRYFFTDKFTKTIKTGAWATRKVKNIGTDETMDWNVEISDSSRAFKIESTIEKEQADAIELDLIIDPDPGEGDFIEISFNCKSKYLNPIFSDEFAESSPFFKLDNKKYECGDGSLFISRTKFAKVQFRFPVEYGLKMDDFVPIVGSLTSKFDYIATEEMKRIKISKENFGDSYLIEITVESPLLHHIYGLAWNPPCRK